MMKFVPSATGSRCRQTNHALVPDCSKGVAGWSIRTFEGRMRATGSERAKEELSGYKRPKLQIWACRMMTNGGKLIKDEGTETYTIWGTRRPSDLPLPGQFRTTCQFGHACKDPSRANSFRLRAPSDTGA